jgi:hypothetical protein
VVGVALLCVSAGAVSAGELPVARASHIDTG